MAWEDCEGNIRRQEVPGGWIYKVPVGTTPGGVSEVVAALFVPEPSKVTDDYHKGFEMGVKVTPKEGYYVEHNGDHWQSVFPSARSYDSQNHETVMDAINYMRHTCGVTDVIVVVGAPEKVSPVNEATTDYQRGWDAGYKASKDERVTPLSPEQVKQHQSDLSQSYDKAYKDGWDAALLTFPPKLNPYSEREADQITPSLRREVMELLRSASEHLDDLEVRYAQTKIVRAMNKLEGI